MKRAILSAALAVAFLAGVAAQAKPNFAGTWQPDAAARGTNVGPQTITVEGNKMTITRTIRGKAASILYMLDGTPSKNDDIGAGAKATCTSKWEGDVLVTTLAITPAAAPDFIRTEKRWIEADGTMKVENSWMGGHDGNTPVRIMEVFKKVPM
jgi:hypothetical protein